MDVKFEGLPQDERAIVYVRPVPVSELPAELRAQAEGLEVIYAVHRPDGARLALVADRKLAFALARSHDMAPVSVH